MAVVSFTENGEYVSDIDAEATTADKLAGYPRLQQIVKAINDKEAASSPGKGGTSNMPLVPVLPPGAIPPGVGAPAVRPPAPGPALLPGVPPPPVQGMSPGLRPALSPGAIALTNNVRVPIANSVSTGVPPHLSPSPLPVIAPNLDPPGGGNAQLNLIISQLNAKLDARERGRKAFLGAEQVNGAAGIPINPLALPRLPGQPAPAALTLASPLVSSVAMAPPVLPGGLLASQSPGLPQPPHILPSPLPKSLPQTGSGILGSVPSLPPSSLARSSPMLSIPGPRPLTPELQQSALLPSNGTGPLLPSATTLGMLGGMMVPHSYAMAGLQPSLTTIPGITSFDAHQMALIPKDNTHLAAGALTLQAKDKLQGMYCPAPAPIAANSGLAQLPTGVVLNQPIKRPLADVTQTTDKRIKYF